MMEEQACLLTFFTARVQGAWRHQEENTFVFHSCHEDEVKNDSVKETYFGFVINFKCDGLKELQDKTKPFKIHIIKTNSSKWAEGVNTRNIPTEQKYVTGGTFWLIFDKLHSHSKCYSGTSNSSTYLDEDLWQEVWSVYGQWKKGRDVGEHTGQNERVFGFVVQHGLQELHALING